MTANTESSSLTTDQQALRTALQEGVVEVVFTKVNGVQRTIRGTIKPEEIKTLTAKANKLEHEETVRAANPAVQPVWDTENGGWRSFRWDRMVSWTTDFEVDPDPAVNP